MILCDNKNMCAMHNTGLNVRKISNELYRKSSYPPKIICHKCVKEHSICKAYFSSYPNDLAICTIISFLPCTSTVNLNATYSKKNLADE